MHTAKALIRLGRCQGLSESLLGTEVVLLVLSCCGSKFSLYTCPLVCLGIFIGVLVYDSGTDKEGI